MEPYINFFDVSSNEKKKIEEYEKINTKKLFVSKNLETLLENTNKIRDEDFIKYEFLIINPIKLNLDEYNFRHITKEINQEKENKFNFHQTYFTTQIEDFNSKKKYEMFIDHEIFERLTRRNKQHILNNTLFEFNKGEDLPMLIAYNIKLPNQIR